LERISLKVATTALTATVYSLLTVALGPLGYSWIQVRLGEALTPLPFLIGFPAVAGLTLGCVIANWFSPVGLPDLIFGPLLTLFAAFLSWKMSINRKMMACVYPVLVNGFGVSAYVSLYYNVPYWISVMTITVGESVAAILIGYPLLVAIEKAVIGTKIKGIKPRSDQFKQASKTRQS
jgi:uncharacterized membrane protein